jgi:hypothetical protein
MISINKCQRSIELLSSLTSEFNNDKDKENKETIETFYKSISSILEDFDLRSEFPYTAPV